MTLTDKDMPGLTYLIQAAKAEAWEEGYKHACTYHLTEDELNDLHAANPYKENN